MSKFVNRENILNKIAETARQRVEEAKKIRPFAQIQDEWQALRPRPKDFTHAFRNAPGIIAEVKKASPSQGDIAPQLDPLAVARAYLENGAAALSVLTEPLFFKGDMNALKSIRDAHPSAYLLQKDFIVDVFQLYEAALAGADAILLIVAMLEPKDLRMLNDCAQKLGLSVLVEVHNAEELAIAKDLNPRLLGVNNRNLKDMTISLDNSRQLIRSIPSGAIAIAESGIQRREDIEELCQLGFKGFLVGTHLMQSGDPGTSLRALLGTRL